MADAFLKMLEERNFPYFAGEQVGIKQLLRDLGPAEVLGWLEQRNRKDLEDKVDNDLNPSKTDFGIFIHTVASNDAAELRKGLATYGDFATTVMSLTGFTFAALVSEDALRSYIFHLIEGVGWGITEEREGIADRLIEMYRRRMGLPRQLSQEALFNWWDFWQDQGVAYPCS